MDDLVAFANRAALFAEAAKRIADALCAGMAGSGGGCAALSGGSTPAPAYHLLAAQALDWPHVTFALVDERFVAPDHPASNEALLRRALAPALAAGARLLPLFASGLTPDEASARAGAIYATLHFDMVVMGMGADGHTASWFPGAEGLRDALDPANPRMVTALRAPQAEGAADRLSLTLAAVARADQVLMLITGDQKRELLAAALSSHAGPRAPVAALFDHLRARPTVLWAP
jgi:6-phosphogluconolactonase